MSALSMSRVSLRPVWQATRWSLRWSWTHTRFILRLVVAALVVRLVFGTVAAALVLIGGWVAPVLGMAVWQMVSPVSFETRLAGPLRRRGWRRYLRDVWPKFAERAGLSITETLTVRNRWNGTHTRQKVTIHPALQDVTAKGEQLSATVVARIGQTSAQVESAAPALADAMGAHSVRTVPVGPGMVRVEMVMRDLLSAPFPARCSTDIRTDAVPLGRREDGTEFALTIAGLHTLITGCSGSGKGSWFWGVALGLAPAIRAGMVELIGIDLKYGMEARLGAGLFAGLATSESEAVRALAYANEQLERRGRALSGHVRQHSPRPGDPLIVVLIDELAALTAYVQDKDAKKEADRLLRTILTKGRALGVLVVGALQDPRKETLPMRQLFTQTVALRLRSYEEVTMVLGEGMTGIAPAHRIRPDQQGMAYVVVEDGSVVRVRANYADDALIRRVSSEYVAVTEVSLEAVDAANTVPAHPGSDNPSTDAPHGTASGSAPRTESSGEPSGGRKPRKPRAPRKPRGSAGTTPDAAGNA